MRLEIPATPAVRVMSFVAVAAMTVQVLLLAEPAFAVRMVEGTWDKAIHFIFFGVMAFFLWISADKRWPLAVFAAIVLIGAIDETQQMSMPGRSADIEDLLADGFGAAAALIVAQKITGDRPRISNTEKRGLSPVNGG